MDSGQLSNSVNRSLGLGSGLWPAFKQCEQKNRNGQWTVASSEEEGEQKTRKGQWTVASCVEEGEQKTRNGQWTLVSRRLGMGSGLW